jgi:hypothetical protein
MTNWLILTMWENESSVSIVKALSDCGKYICPDRHDEQEGWLKWDVTGYSDKHIKELAGKIEKQLLSVADGDIRYEFATE